jgi:clan AA aspartic protease
VKGNVDERNRALITISVSNQVDGQYDDVVAWIDTAFDGHLVFSARLIKQLGLDPLVETEAILADGSKVALETYLCFVEWFGERIPVQVIANEGKFPLLGTELLIGRELSISYVTKELRLD